MMGPALMRLSGVVFAVCVAPWAASQSVSGWSGGPLLLNQLLDGSGGSLLGSARIEPAGMEAADTLSTDPQTGLVLRQRYHAGPERQCLVIESTLSNPTGAPQHAGPVRLADWGFRVAGSDDAMRYHALTYRNEEWYGSTFWAGPDWTRVGKDWHHPGNGTPSVRRFTAPRDGRVAISGRVYKADTNNGGGDGVRLMIRHGARAVWQGEIDGADAAGLEPRLELDVLKGDAIRFVVHKRGAIAYDTTHWDPVVTYADGTRFQASEGFSTTEQGAGGWAYEMDVDSEAGQYAPRASAFGIDGGLREEPVTPGAVVAFSHAEAMPVVAVSDAVDGSGIALVLDDAGPWGVSCRVDDGLLYVSVTSGGDEPGVS
ncbi:MAG: hypothetical protein JXR94_22740, partial [Candidatus Hydrogenedentes bacterium]|nr:hypothetical protein [Candidatus Hydrogenedentota bacterium]